jgi:hypothetical protein
VLRSTPHPPPVQVLDKLEILLSFWGKSRIGSGYPGVKAAFDLCPLQHAVGVVSPLKARSL